jgi:hypothetical protein
MPHDRASRFVRAKTAAEFYGDLEARRGIGLLYDAALAALTDARRAKLTAHASAKTEQARALVRQARDSDPLGLNIPSPDVIQTLHLAHLPRRNNTRW